MKYIFHLLTDFMRVSVCACTYVCTRVHVHAMVHMWRLENNLQELVLPFYSVGPRAQTQVVWLSGYAPSAFTDHVNVLAPGAASLSCFLQHSALLLLFTPLSL